MRVREMVVIVRPENIGRDDRGEVAPVLVVVGAVGNVHHPLRVRVSEVTLVWGPGMDHGFVDGVGCLVREDAGG